MALKDLLAPRTREQIMLDMLLQLGQERYVGMPITDWHSGGVTRTISEISAEAISDTERLLEQLGYGLFLQTAGGEWLDELVQSQYGITRQEATFARGLVEFKAAPGVSAEIRAGTLIQTESGIQYATLTDASLQTNGSVTVEVQALTAGSVANVASGTITQMLSPIPGVTVTNGKDWMTSAGADRESDDALKQRAMLRWPTLGSGMTAKAYEYLARTASPSVDQVRVLDQHPRGQGTLDVVVWGSGGIGAADVAAVDAAVQAARPLTADVRVYSAVPREIQITLELYGPLLTAEDRTRIAGEIASEVEQLARETQIGGTLYNSQLIDIAVRPGVLDARRQGSEADIHLGDIEGLILQTTITWRIRP